MRYACVRLAQVTLEKFVALAGIEMAGESERINVGFSLPTPRSVTPFFAGK